MDSNKSENISIESVDDKKSLMHFLDQRSQKIVKNEKLHMKQTLDNCAQNRRNTISSDDESLPISNNYPQKKNKRTIDSYSDSDSDLESQLYTAKSAKRRKHHSGVYLFKKKYLKASRALIIENSLSSSISDVKKTLFDMKDELLGLSKSTGIFDRIYCS